MFCVAKGLDDSLARIAKLARATAGRGAFIVVTISACWQSEPRLHHHHIPVFVPRCRRALQRVVTLVAGQKQLRQQVVQIQTSFQKKQNIVAPCCSEDFGVARDLAARGGGFGGCYGLCCDSWKWRSAGLGISGFVGTPGL